MWDIRGHGRYYYRYKKVRGQKYRDYVGTGPEAEQAALEDIQRYLEREYRRDLRQREQAAHEAAEAPLLHLCQSTDLICRASLVASGFYQHDRGEWRRRVRATRKPVTYPNR
jgi:hypothetical protein